jgi:hypothetical protein
LIIAAKGGGTTKNKMGVWLETIIIDFFLQQMVGFLAIEFRFSFTSFLFMLELLFISFGLPNIEVWVIIMDNYMHWPMQRLKY